MWRGSPERPLAAVSTLPLFFAGRIVGEPQVPDQEVELAPFVALLSQPEQIRRVHGDKPLTTLRQGDQPPAIGVDRQPLAHQRARGRYT